MSLIHEALKKAEKQRHLGEAPTLNSPLFIRRRSRRWLLPLVVLVIILGGGYLAWQVVGHRAAPASTAVVPVDGHAAAPTPSNAANDSVPVTAPAVPAATIRKTQPAAHTAPPSQSPPLQNPAARASSQPPRTAQPPALVDGKPAAPVNTSAKSPQTAPSDAAAAEPAAAQPAPAPTSPMTHITAKPAASPVPAAHAASASLPYFWQLPYADRKDVPELQISMHVYAPIPADRFVIINGERYVEGDDLGNGLTLDEIRSEGIVVEMNGKRFVVSGTDGH